MATSDTLWRKRLATLLPDAPDSLLERLAHESSPAMRWSRQWLRALDWSSLPAFGAPLHRLEEQHQQRWLQRLSRQPGLGRLVGLASTPLRLPWLDQPEVRARAGQRDIPTRPAQEAPARWKQNLTTLADWPDDVIEADVVVVGTGAGGATAAWELASHGLAVLMIEEGPWLERSDFADSVPHLVQRLYRHGGLTGAVGLPWLPIPLGRCVGGTTTINSGTCIRTPGRILRQWQAEGLSMLNERTLNPCFESIEAILQVQPAERRHVGPIADVIERGAQALGWQHAHVLQRNAAGCDGQGLCQFGCPTGAKQSTLQSVVPAALARGASLISGARATRLLRKGDQVQGVCIVGEDGRERQVHARSTVLAMGSLLTPAFLQAQGVRLPWLGRNLSVHPAGAVSAWFPGESFGNSQVIPQGFGVSDLAEAGILFEGATPPLPALGALAPQLGRDFADTVDRYPETAWFGFMIRDTSRGQVRHIPGLPFPWVSYRMNGEDFRRFRYAQQKLGELFFAAGARSLQLPGYEAEPEITSVEQLRQCLARSRTPADFLVSAYHPLGTCRLGLGTEQGVCDPTHRVFGLHNLYVMDGSSVPSALGANPQVTIMALALRSARQLAERLSHEA